MNIDLTLAAVLTATRVMVQNGTDRAWWYKIKSYHVAGYVGRWFRSSPNMTVTP